MLEYFISYGIGPGMDATEVIECFSQQEAEDHAYERAKDLYESFAGLHGVMTVEDVAREYEIDDPTSSEAYETYEQHVEEQIDYYTQVYDPDEHDMLL